MTNIRVNVPKVQAMVAGAAKYVEESKLFDCVFPLVLLKHISDTFDDDVDTLRVLFDSKEETTQFIRSSAEAGSVPLTRWHVPEEAHWLYIKMSDNKRHCIGEALRLLNKQTNGGLLDFLTRDELYRDVPDAVLHQIVDLISQFRFGDEDHTILSEVFISLHPDRAARTILPQDVYAIATALLDYRRNELVCDPSCNTGEMLHAVRAHVGASYNASLLFGQEQHAVAVRIARINNLLSWSPAHIAEGNAIENFAYRDQKFGRCITQIRDTIHAYNWLQFILSILEPDGKAVVLLTEDSISDPTRNQQLVRHIESIIALPEQISHEHMFLVLTARENDGTVFVVNARKWPTDGSLPDIITRYDNLYYLCKHRYEEGGFARVVSIGEIGANHYRLSPAVYV